MNSVKAVTTINDVSEMAVVDTFTKLIFEQDSDYTPDESAIIEALRLEDDNLLMDTPHQMGAYLKALGVAEMVKLVGRVMTRLEGTTPSGSATHGRAHQRSSRHLQ